MPISLNHSHLHYFLLPSFHPCNRSLNPLFLSSRSILNISSNLQSNLSNQCSHHPKCLRLRQKCKSGMTSTLELHFKMRKSLRSQYRQRARKRRLRNSRRKRQVSMRILTTMSLITIDSYNMILMKAGALLG